MRRALLELLIPSGCPACDRARFPGQPLLCETCRGDLAPWRSIGAIHTAVAYRGSGRALLHRFKFQGRRDALEVLLEPLRRRVEALDFDALVAIPRHPERVRSQGSDPAHTLARALAQAVGRPLLDGVLERSRPTLPQSELGPGQRWPNVAGSFRTRPAALRGRRVLLLDDVATTGATLATAARELWTRAGPRSLECAALAGTPALPKQPEGPPSVQAA